jgi:hypothetical protein
MRASGSITINAGTPKQLTPSPCPATRILLQPAPGANVGAVYVFSGVPAGVTPSTGTFPYITLAAGTATQGGQTFEDAVDCSVSATGTGTSWSSGTCTTTNAHDTLVGALFSISSQGGTLTHGSGYTAEVLSNNSRELEDQNVSVTGSYAATGSYSSSQTWIAFLAALKRAN